MRNIVRSVIRFIKGDEGVTAVECALMLALVVVICIVAINQMGASPVSNEPVVIQTPAN